MPRFKKCYKCGKKINSKRKICIHTIYKIYKNSTGTSWKLPIETLHFCSDKCRFLYRFSREGLRST
jgi:predicted nucleic acid-binding Zn ribbon protein